MTQRAWLLVVALVVVAVMAPLSARAQKRVVVADIAGAPSSKLRDEIAALLEDRHTVLDGLVYREAAKRLDALGDSPESVARVSQEIRVDGVIDGELQPDGLRYVLRLRVLEGATGKTIKRLSIRVRASRLSESMKLKVADRLLAAINELAPLPPPEAVADSAAGDGSEVEQPDADGPTMTTKIVSLVPDEPRETRTAERSTALPPGERARRGPLVLAVGASVITRSLSFASRAGFAEAPRDRSVPLAGGVYAAGELYPMAIDPARRESVLANLGLGFVVERAIGVSAQVATDAAEPAVPATQMQVSAGVRIRHNFGRTPRWPSIRVGVGMGQLSFTTDRSVLADGTRIDVPDTVYTFVDPGLAVRVPITERVAVNLAARALLITDAGEVQSREQYGSAMLTGVDAEGGIEVLATKRLVMRLEGRLTQIGYDLEGNGMQSNSRDGDPTSVDIGGMTDRFVGGHLTVGYLF